METRKLSVVEVFRLLLTVFESMLQFQILSYAGSVSPLVQIDRMDCSDTCKGHSCFPEDESYRLWSSPDFSFRATMMLTLVRFCIM